MFMLPLWLLAASRTSATVIRGPASNRGGGGGSSVQRGADRFGIQEQNVQNLHLCEASRGSVVGEEQKSRNSTQIVCGFNWTDAEFCSC